MRATFISPRGFRVTIEPMKNQSREQLEKKVKQIMRKRGIVTEYTIE